jgi:hypothetical protein
MPPAKARRAQSVPDTAPPQTAAPEANSQTEVQQLRQEVERLGRELRAHQEREAREKEAAGLVRATEHELEGAKAHTAAIKEKLAQANQALAAIVMGGAQTSFLEKKPEDAGEEPASEAERRWLGCKQVDAEKARVTFPAIDEVCPMGHEPLAPSEKPLSVTPVTLYGELPFLVAEHYGTDGFRCFACLPLLSKDEWQQLYEAKYGRAVEGFDQSDEAKHQRQLGGPDCGRVVKLGRKKAVVGPKEQALIVCFETVEDLDEHGDPAQGGAGEDDSDPEEA